MIHKNMSVREVVQRYPETMQVFEKYGLGCAGCEASLFEDLEQGAAIHGIDATILVESLNQVLSDGSRK